MSPPVTSVRVPRGTYASARAQGRAAGLMLAVFTAPFGVSVANSLDAGDLVPLAVLAVLAAFGTRRAQTMRVEADAEGLLVRNVFTTRRLRWDDIVGFERRPVHLVSRGWRDTVCPVAVTRDGRRVTLVAMPVEQRPRSRPWRRFKAAAVVEGWEAALPP